MLESGSELALHPEPGSVGQIASILSAMVCRHCGRNPYSASGGGEPHRGASADRGASPDGGASADLADPPDRPRHAPADGVPAGPDAVGDEERALWTLADEADRIRAQAPVAPEPAEISAARRAVAAATATQRTVEAQVNAVELALSRPGSWLRPRHRLGLTATLRRGRAAYIAAVANREQAEYEYAELDQRSAARRRYLAMHQETLVAADAARRNLERRVDDLIDAYGRQPEPPAWFRFGLGYPPRADAYQDWLVKARAAISYRRRHNIDHPLEPTGGPVISRIRRP